MSETEQNQELNLPKSQDKDPLEKTSLEEELEKIQSKETSENLTQLEEDIDLESELISEIEEKEEFILKNEEEELNKLTENIANLTNKKETLLSEIDILESKKNKLLSQQQELQISLDKIVRESVKDLEEKKQNLEVTIQKLERRQERIREEMRTTFAGVSQDLAIRVQGFKDYLVGSLQDLAATAEQLELPSPNEQTWDNIPQMDNQPRENVNNPQFAQNSFQKETKKIQSLLDKYRTKPDYYGPPWQLRRTFEPIHAERVSDWFFSQGGKGSIKTMGSRLQNILISSAIISVLYNVYGDRSRTLILANTPERLGEWRRGLQDCLGISRSDFGPERGVVLFENPEALSQKAERLLEDEYLPLIIMDQTDDLVSLSLLQFPLWLAFAPEAQPQNSNYFY